MAINKKLIYYNRTLANFKSDANGLNGQTTASGGNVGNIPYASIVFTSDGYIWTHGKEFNCNNTWRGIQNNLTSTSTTDSLSAYQGKILNEKFANYLPLSGGTLTGALTVPSLTVTGASSFSQAINASILGNAATASRLQNARTINGTSFDGSANITTANWGTARNISIADSDSTNTGTAVSVNGSAAVTLKLPATIKATLSGNASSATKLATARTIWGQSFDGTAAISGNMTGVGTLNNIIGFNSNGTNAKLNVGEVSENINYIHLYVSSQTSSYTYERPLVLQNGYGKVGIGVAQPSNKLDVAGDIGLTGQLKSSVATGTAPLVVASTTAVTNLNADLLDGQHGSYYATASSLGSYVTLSTAQTISGNKTFSSSVSIDDLTAGNLVVTGGASFVLTINGNITSADKVNNNLTIQLNSGTTDGTDKFIFDGSANKLINITPSSIGAKATQSAVSDPSASGTGISYIATISLNAQGVITATKSTVRSASTSLSGIVTTGELSFAGTKTFTGNGWGTQVIIERNNANYGTAIRYDNSNGVLGYIGVSNGKNPIWATDSSHIYTLYHTDNLSIGTLMGSTAIGDSDEPVYWSGSAFVKAGAYPTKSSWNYDDVYLKDLGLDTGNSTDKNKSVSLTNGNVYLKLFKTINGAESEDSKVKIYGDTNVTVTTDSNGDIKIIGVDSVSTAINADTVDSYHAMSAGSLLYKYQVTATIPASSVTGDFWYATITFARSYVYALTRSLLDANYSNVQGQVYLNTYTYLGAWYAFTTTYNGSNIKGIAYKSQNNPIYYVKLAKPTTYNNTIPDGKITVYSPYDCTITVSATAPSGVTFTNIATGAWTNLAANTAATATSASSATTATYASNVGASGTAGTNYVTAANVISMYNWYNGITATDEASNTAIDKWNEIVSFLAGITDTSTLSGILANYLPLSGGTMTGALTTPGLTVTGAATFSLAINGSILGNATTASRLLNARTITVGSTSKSFDGSANISFTLSEIGALAAGSYVTISGTQTISGAKTFSNDVVIGSTSANKNLEVHGTGIFENTSFGSQLEIWRRADNAFSAIKYSGGTTKTTLGYIGITYDGDTQVGSKKPFWNDGSASYKIIWANANSTTAVGGSTTPVYVDKNGQIKACTAYSSASVNYASSAGAVAWSGVSDKPTTATRWPTYAEVTSKPTTLSGYGITDGLYSTQVALSQTSVSWAIDKAKTVRRGFVYNTSGYEYSYLFALSSTNTTINDVEGYPTYGAILKMGYTDKYLRILRIHEGKWYKTDGTQAALGSTNGVDWTKIYAGYADSAASATIATSLKYIGSVSSLDSGCTSNGIYAHSNTATGKPLVNAFGNLLNISNKDTCSPGTDNHWIQLLDFTHEGSIWHRQIINTGSWTTWEKILTTANWTGIIDGRYLLLSGGTMTGALTVPGLTVSGSSTFSQAINGSILGNAATASRLQNARTISLTGSVTGSGSFDGSGNLSITTTTNHNHNSSYMTAAALFTGASGATSATASLTNGNVYVNATKTINGTTTNVGSIKISGSGSVSVTTDANKHIVITGSHAYTSSWTSKTDNVNYPIAFSPNATPSTSGNGYNANFTFNPSTKTFNNNGAKLVYDSTNKVLKFYFD